MGFFGGLGKALAAPGKGIHKAVTGTAKITHQAVKGAGGLGRKAAMAPARTLTGRR